MDKPLTASARTVWLAYCAMATALVPLIFMGVGYLFLGQKRREEP